MKVLWLVNIMLPVIGEHLKKNYYPICGWLSGLSSDLIKKPNIQLVVCFPQEFSDEVLEGTVDNLEYYGFPKDKKNFTANSKQNQNDLLKIVKKVNPDIVHIFGTERVHSNAMMNACVTLGLEDRVVIHIQGLVSIIGKYHYYAYLEPKVVLHKSFRDFVKSHGIVEQRNEFIKQGEIERECIKKAKYVLGRTDWDEACVKQINPNATYMYASESLRDEFYKYNWDLDKCEKHSIFMSQVHYPIKGFHLFLEVFPMILEKYPDAHLYVAGKDLINVDNISKFKQNGYQKYIRKLILKNRLDKHITFLGSLNEKEMCQRYLKSHVFICPSSIENSSNSVAEATILGVPTIASDVGGMRNILIHEKEGYIYPSDEPYMIPYYIEKIFGDDNNAKELSINAIKHAKKLYDREANTNRVLEIYNEIVHSENNGTL